MRDGGALTLERGGANGMETEQLTWIAVDEVEDSAVGGNEADEAITVEPMGNGRYRLLTGSARLKRCRREGRRQVEAVVQPVAKLDRLISDLLTRTSEGRLHFLSEAESCQRLLDTGRITRAQLAARLGKPQSSLQRRLRLLALSTEVRELVVAHRLSEQHALQLLRIPGNQGRLRMAEHMGQERLTAKEAEVLVDRMLERMPVPVPRQRRYLPLMRDYRLYLNAFRGIVEQMQDAGLDAELALERSERLVEVRVSIPVFRGKKQA